MRFVTLLSLLYFLLYADVQSQWQFDWNKRTDHYDKKAGIFEETPFPITENTTSYSVTNDEGTKTFELGQKYFVDGGYQGGNSNGSFQNPYTTINSALQNTSNGNITIVVRGAHDSFSGIYFESIRLSGHYGVDDLHRYMVVGYGNERPILDGNNSSGNLVSSTGETNAYVTIQRFKLQNTKGNGVRLGNYNEKRDAYFNIIDLWMYNCVSDVENLVGDGCVYYLNADNGWVYHCVAEHTHGHGFKIGDGADNVVIEWSIAKECGYWDGYPVSSRSVGHPSGLDFPSDGPNQGGGTCENIICRYNICHTTLFYAVQLRHTPNFEFHHNEIYDGIQYGNVSGSSSRSIGAHQIIIFESTTYGKFYSNVIRDPGPNESGGTRGIYFSGLGNQNEVLMYNNLLYGHDEAESIYINSNNSGITVQLHNNSIYAKRSSGSLLNSGIGNRLNYQNNILYVDGGGRCVSVGTADHTYNLFYAPNGTIGTSLTTGELNENPDWELLPSADYRKGYGDLTRQIKGISLNSYFNLDINDNVRVNWSMGAYEYIQGKNIKSVDTFNVVK